MYSKHLVLFDGYCHLCDGSVKFILKHDRKETFAFASLQSVTGQKILDDFKIDRSTEGSIVYIRNNKALIRSQAALWIASELAFPANLIAGLVIFPPFIRDCVYKIIAKNRYKWFGKRDSCMIPNEKFRKRFIDL